MLMTVTLALPLLAALVGPPTPSASAGAPAPAIPSTITPARPDPALARARALGLRPRADGGFEYAGATGERFDATIHRDGTVEFHLDPTIQIKPDGVCLIAVCVVRGMAKGARQSRRQQVKRAAVVTIAELAAGLVAGAAGLPLPRTTPLQLAPGSQPPPGGTTALGIPGSGSLTNPSVPNHVGGTVQGRYGYLPQPTAAMTAFMDRTFELRLELVKAADQERLERELERLPLALLEAWSAAPTLAQRHELVLQAWDDLIPLPSPHRDAVLTASADRELERRREDAATRARAVILELVRERAPAGSASAFTRAELDAFNRGRPARDQFTPYAAVAHESRAARSPR